MKCCLCDDKNEDESEIHLLKCIKITQNISSSIDLSNATYEHIFSNDLEEQILITKTFDQVFKTRSLLINSS